MSAIPINPRTYKLGIASGQYRETDIGTEKRCTRCGEFWPVDTDFYSSQRTNGTERASSHCRACLADRYKRKTGQIGMAGAA